MKVIDTHCIFGRWPKAKRDISLELLLRNLEVGGFDAGLVTSMLGVFTDPEAGNRETLAACEEHPQLIPVATIKPLRCIPGSNVPAELAARGFKMIRFFPILQEWTTQNVLFERTLEQCAEAGLLVAFPIGKWPDVASQLGRMVPQGCRLIMSNVYYNAMNECVEVMLRREEFTMELGHVCVPGGVEFLIEHLGSERLVLGSNQPLESAGGAVLEVQEAEISEADKAAVLGGTISRLLGEVGS